MSEKKIVDYIVVHRKDTGIAFMERINVKIQEFEKKLRSLENELARVTKPLPQLIAVKEDFEQLKSVKEGDNYPGDASSIESWAGGHTYSYPFRRSIGDYSVRKVTSGHILTIHKTCSTMEKKIEEILTEKTEIEQQIKTVKSNIEGLKANQDPTENKDFRTAFEKDVLSLLNKGYVLQGGVTSSRGYINQAMVKYGE